MRIVHILDTVFLGVPEGACVHVAHCYDYNLAITLPGVPAQTVIFSFVNDEGCNAGRMKAHVTSEAARFRKWLTGGADHSEFEFQRVMDLGGAVADEPCRIRKEGGAA